MGKFFRKITQQEAVNKDFWQLSIYGQDLLGINTKLYSGSPSNGFDLETIIDATKYPFLELEATLADSLALTPPQLKKWQVIHSGVAEGTLYFSNQVVDTSSYSIENKAEGNKFTLPFAFKNISSKSYTTDSLTVRYTIFNKSQFTQSIIFQRIKAPLPDSITIFTQEFNTLSLAGSNYIQIFVNPRIVPELYFNNNIYELPSFSVLADSTNPILDVTFNGKRIANGEKVSPNVSINVSLLDDNKLFFKTDTTNFSMLIRKPCVAAEVDSCGFENIRLASQEVTYSFGNFLNNNRFTVQYQPKSWQTGSYRLRVNGSDAKNNISGVKPYEVDFEVVNDCEILEFYPYPNPMHDRCNFYLRLICPENITDIKLRISDINGKVVNELTEKELIINKTGNNIIDYAWNGTGDKGNMLQSGIYVYRLIATKSSDQSTLRQIGKIVIIR